MADVTINLTIPDAKVSLVTDLYIYRYPEEGIDAMTGPQQKTWMKEHVLTIMKAELKNIKLSREKNETIASSTPVDDYVN